MVDNIKSLTLKDNRECSFYSFRIEEIPDRIITHYTNDEDGERNYQEIFRKLIEEVFQFYKINSRNDAVEISSEILFYTKETKNQTFEANIEMYFILRVISSQRYSSLDIINQIILAVKKSLLNHSYSLSVIQYDQLVNKILINKDNCLFSIVKEEKIEELHSQVLSSYFDFDIFNIEYTSMKQFLNVLSSYPNTVVSFQLIPTRFKSSEESFLTNMSQSLNYLNQGIINQGFNQFSVEGASEAYRKYSYYRNNKNSALFTFNINIYADKMVANTVYTSLYPQLKGKDNVRLQINEVYGLPLNSKTYYCFPWLMNQKNFESRNRIIQSNNHPFYRLPYIITSEEAASFFRLPLKTEEIGKGLKVNDSKETIGSYIDNLINTGDISIGMLKSSKKGDRIGISLNDLTKHMLVVGTPGSGKTTFSIALLDQLWKVHKKPFIVIEPAKNEYRALIESIPDIQIFTPGKNQISPFIFNPFIPPKNVTLETYKPTLKTAFSAAIPLDTPLDLIFEDTVNNCYSKFRWLDTYTIGNKGLVFNISDFIKCFEETFDMIGYTGEAKNIGRAGKVRLKSLIKLFDNYYSIPIEDILAKPTIIELAAIENTEEKALIISLLLLSIMTYVNSNYIGDGNFRNLLLLEEAHVLLESKGNASSASEIAQGLFKRMLAEMRSYGFGIVVADQSPRKVSEDVVALTDIKMVFRLVEGNDKRIIEESTNMGSSHFEKLSRLKPGEAFLFFNKLDNVEEIKTDNYRLDKKISISLSDDEISKLTTYWKDKGEKTMPYPECHIVPTCKNDCNYCNRVLSREVAKRIFTKYFSKEPTIGSFKECMKRISYNIKCELNDEEFNNQVLFCVKVHLFRMIRYETKLNIPKAVYDKSLMGELRGGKNHGRV